MFLCEKIENYRWIDMEFGVTGERKHDSRTSCLFFFKNFIQLFIFYNIFIEKDMIRSFVSMPFL